MSNERPRTRLFETEGEPLPGVLLLRAPRHTDSRGSFVKTMNSDAFEVELGLRLTWVEDFHTVSGKGVVRGMHFQRPPCAHAKLVHCIRGRVLDVLLDLRRSSPTYLRHAAVELSEQAPQLLYIPPGLAHGFASLEEGSTLLYKTSTVHSPAHDEVIRWDSLGFDWPVPHPVISERDARGIPLADYSSPFE